MTLDYQPKVRKPAVRDDVAYMIPMAVFLVFTQIGGSFPKLYAASYVAKTLVVPVLLYWLWNYYTKIKWTHLTLGVIVGVIGLVQWVGMEKFLLHYFPNYPRASVDIYNPFKAISHPALAW